MPFGKYEITGYPESRREEIRQRVVVYHEDKSAYELRRQTIEATLLDAQAACKHPLVTDHYRPMCEDCGAKVEQAYLETRYTSTRVRERSDVPVYTTKYTLKQEYWGLS